MTEFDEADRVRRSKAGDAQAFGELIDAHQRALFNVAYRMVGNYHEAQDLTQTALVKAYEKIGGFDGRCPFFGWVYRILVHEALNSIARRKRQRVLEGVDPESAPGPETTFGEHEVEGIIQSALEALNEEQRQVIILRHFAQLSYYEIGETLGVPEKTIKSRLFTARQRLREILVRRGVTTP